MSINEKVLVKLRQGRELIGKLVAYDDHLNLMLSDTVEKIKQEKNQAVKKDHSIVFVRGDLVIMVSPLG